MTAITLTPTLPGLASLPPTIGGGAVPDTFAPVLASLLTDAPKPATALLPGISMPPDGEELPVASIPAPVAPSPQPVSNGPNDRRTLAPPVEPTPVAEPETASADTVLQALQAGPSPRPGPVSPSSTTKPARFAAATREDAARPASTPQLPALAAVARKAPPLPVPARRPALAPPSSVPVPTPLPAPPAAPLGAEPAAELRPLLLAPRQSPSPPSAVDPAAMPGPVMSIPATAPAQPTPKPVVVAMPLPNEPTPPARAVPDAPSVAAAGTSVSTPAIAGASAAPRPAIAQPPHAVAPSDAAPLTSRPTADPIAPGARAGPRQLGQASPPATDTDRPAPTGDEDSHEAAPPRTDGHTIAADQLAAVAPVPPIDPPLQIAPPLHIAPPSPVPVIPLPVPATVETATTPATAAVSASTPRPSRRPAPADDAGPAPSPILPPTDARTPADRPKSFVYPSEQPTATPTPETPGRSAVATGGTRPVIDHPAPKLTTQIDTALPARPDLAAPATVMEPPRHIAPARVAAGVPPPVAPVRSDRIVGPVVPNVTADASPPVRGAAPASPRPAVADATPERSALATAPTISNAPAPSIAPATPTPPPASTISTRSEPTASAAPDRMVSAVTRAVPELEAHLAAAPVPAQPRADQLAAIRPAFEAFGAALHRAAAAERRPAAASRLAPGLGDQAIIAAAPTVTLTLSDQPAIDTTAPHWPEAMIARIERLRDEHNAPGGAGDTRIRLHPDALGPIDVTLRRDGDAVQVQLRAAEPATRALLAEAQPRLNELAEARGLRLTGTDLASGTAQGGQGWTGDRRQPAPAPAPLPTRPSRQSANDTADDDPTDTRLA